MKIRPFVSYSKWPGELGSIGCVFIAFSLPCVRLSPQDHFFNVVHFVLLVEFEFLSSSSSILYC